MDNVLLKIAVLWIAIDTFLIATGWYLATTIRPLCPDWWRRVVVADEVSPFTKL